MLNAVLKSDTVIQTSIKIINSFVKIREYLSSNSLILQKFEQIEQKLLVYDSKFDEVFKAIEDKSIKPKQGIFYDGEVYDAYIFITDLIKSAKTSIVIVDNYCDESVLTLLSKRDENIKCTIYTKNLIRQLQLDLKKYNAQYPKIDINKFEASHDRFLIIDKEEVYHIGASLKDLCKKWFVFSKMDIESISIFEKLKYD